MLDQKPPLSVCYQEILGRKGLTRYHQIDGEEKEQVTSRGDDPGQ